MAPPPATDTAAVVGPVSTDESASKEAVTVTVWPVAPSSTEVWAPASSASVSTLRVIEVSLSLMVIMAGLTVNPLRVPPRFRISEPSTIWSSTGVMLNSAEPEEARAGMVTLNELTAW